MNSSRRRSGKVKLGWNGHAGRLKELASSFRRAPRLFPFLRVSDSGLAPVSTVGCTLAADITIDETLGSETLVVLFAGHW